LPHMLGDRRRHAVAGRRQFGTKLGQV
jgi:hypothetical protein